MVEEGECSRQNAEEHEYRHDVSSHYANTSMTGAKDVRSLFRRVFIVSASVSAVQMRSFRLLGSVSVVFIMVLLAC